MPDMPRHKERLKNTISVAAVITVVIFAIF